MSIRVVTVPYVGVHVSEMVDGDVAQIVQWDDYPSYIGKVVQRCSTLLVVLGEPFGKSFGNLFTHPENVSPKCRVQILSSGTIFEIID